MFNRTVLNIREIEYKLNMPVSTVQCGHTQCGQHRYRAKQVVELGANQNPFDFEWGKRNFVY
jgi:hypothetical protein